MWFGTKDYSTYIPTPVSGADVSPAAWGSSGTTLNGSGYAQNSFNSHKNYDFSWRQSSARETAQLMKSFFDGTYGRGKLHFQDPLTYTTNVLPARWADPSVTCDFEGPQLVPGVDPSPIITSGFERLKLPVRSAQFNLNGVTARVGTQFAVEATNYFTNPNLQGSGTWQEVRRNLFIDPMMTSTSNWAAPHAQTTLPGGVMRLTRATGIANTLTPSTTGLNGLSGPHSVGYSVTNQAASGIDMRIALWDGSAYSYGPTVTIPAGQTATVSMLNFFSTAGAPYTQPRLHQVGNMSQPVDLLVSRPMFNPGATLESFFNPSATDRSIDPDMRQRWLGNVNASASVMEIELVRGFTGNQCIPGVSTFGGKPAVRLIPTAASGGVTFAYFEIPAGARSGGQMRGTRNTLSPLSGEPNPTYSGLLTGTPLSSAPSQNIAGTQVLTLEYAPVTSGPLAAIGHGGARGSGDVWWTDIGLYPPGYSGLDFNGGSNVPGKITRWTGAPNNSTSELGRLEATGQPNLNDDNAVFIPIPDNMQLNLGAFYTSSTASGGVWVTPVTQGGIVTQQITRLTPLEPDSEELFPDVITKTPGVVGVYLWIGKTVNEDSIVAIRGIHARLSPVGKAPAGVRYWVGGQGNAGVRFQGPPTYINHTGVNGGQVEFAASFKESLF